MENVKKIMKSVITLCICTLFMVLCSSECYAETFTGFIDSDMNLVVPLNMTEDGTYAAAYGPEVVLGKIADSISDMYSEYQDSTENSSSNIKVAQQFIYSDTSITIYPDITGAAYNSEYTVFSISNVQDAIEDSEIMGNDETQYPEDDADDADSTTTVSKVVMVIGEDTYTFYFFCPFVTYREEEEDDEGNFTGWTDSEPVLKSSSMVDDLEGNSISALIGTTNSYIWSLTYGTQYDFADNLVTFLDYVEKAVNMGIIAGSLEYSFNVGGCYSTSLISIEDATEIDYAENGTALGYVFKSSSSIIQVSEYIMNPLIGTIALEDVVDLPTEETDWKIFFSDQNEWYSLFSSYVIDNNLLDGDGGSIFEVAYGIPLNAEYVTFTTGLNEDGINSAGIGIILNPSFDNTIDSSYFDSFNISAEDPQGAVSYNLNMGYPYAFASNSSSYKLDTFNFNIDSNYIYCVYDNNIYTNDADRTLIGSMTSDLRTSRDEIYLYREIGTASSSESTDDTVSSESIFYLPMLLICEYDEVVLDTSVDDDRFYGTGRRVGFSSSFVDRVYLTTADSTLMYTDSDGGKTGYILQNASFVFTDAESAIIGSNVLVSGWGYSSGQQEYTLLSTKTTDAVLASVSDGSSHIAVGSSPEAVKVVILFGQFDAIVEDGDTALKMDNQYGFMLIRNNNYIDDSTLIDWLNSSVSFETFVEPEKLLALIQGDFLSDLEKISYDEWLYIQDIKAELSSDRNRVVIDVMNVTSIVLGTLLLVFAILICLAYWIDIFNSFTEFSILEIVSLGRLYPVEDSDVANYMQNIKTEVKFVRFKDVLLIALIATLLAAFFYNVSAVISVIVCIYYYIQYVMGVLI